MTEFEKSTLRVDADFSLQISNIIDELRYQNVSRETIEQLELAIRHYRKNILQTLPKEIWNVKCGGCEENLTRKCLRCPTYHHNSGYHTTPKD
jgi:hypothetical protein